MPLVFKQQYKEFVKFAPGLVSNFKIGQNKYQNVVRNQLEKEFQATLGVNIMVPKDDMTEDLKEHTYIHLHTVNIKHFISWRVLSSHSPYNSSSKRCNLCLKEKFLIICRPELSTLNKRNELVSSCRHRNKALLRNN